MSLIGDQITVLAMPLLAVLAVGAGPAEMGYLTAAALLPNLLFSVPAGTWVDRHPYKKRVMIVADTGRAVLLALVPLLWIFGSLTLPVLYAVAFATGTLSVFFEVAHSSLFASLVARPDYVAANSLVNGSRAMSYVAGPSAGGLLVQLVTAPFALLADAVTFAASAVFLRRLTTAERPVPAIREEKNGIRYVLEHPILRAILLGTTTLNLFNYIFAALFVLFVTTELHVSPGTLGVIVGLGAVGGLLGATIAGPVSRRLGRLAAVHGFERTVNYGTRPIGAVLGGTLGATFGVRPALWTATLGALLGVVWLLFSPVRSMRTLPAE